MVDEPRSFARDYPGTYRWLVVVTIVVAFLALLELAP